MIKRHEVKLNLNITAFVLADSEDEAVVFFSKELERSIMGVSHDMSYGIEIDDQSFDLQQSEATEL
ncbi:hypothetical protein LCGC14_0483720 [marine sediment metagenome]|uniref:Uncharacterized protein n=1 Tax=marine sediment metagenome TaxID=412755 RepID=A0A0F9UVK8_9ZZZZ